MSLTDTTISLAAACVFQSSHARPRDLKFAVVTLQSHLSASPSFIAHRFR
jgi:hypothetical protein